jgi:hypothetical protein
MTNRGEQGEDLADDQRIDDKHKQEKPKQTFIYKDAGLTERHGDVPRWLWVLVIWGVYYLTTYWESPGATR